MSSKLRACANCGSLWGSIGVLCKFCWKALLSQMNLQVLPLPHFNVYFLLLWTESNAKVVGKLIYSLKGGGLQEGFQQLAEVFVYLARWQSQSVLVPAPAKVPFASDHAFRWAQCLSAEAAFPVKNILFRQSTQIQKESSKKERANVKIGSIGGSGCAKSNIIFVDDVLTTGSTAQAAYEVLGKPENFAVWCLAYRPLLAEK